MPTTRLSPIFIMIPIVLLAALLRLSGIDAQSLWIDEGFTWNLTQYSDPFAILQNDVHPPLYFLMIDVWVELAGVSELALRYFSTLAGLLSVAVAYRLGHEIGRQQGVDERWLGLAAALLLAVAEAETFLAQEARSYTWHVLWVSLSMWGFMRYGRIHQRRDLLLWALSTVALIYTFYLGAFAGVAQGLYALLFWRGRQRLTAIATLIGCALALAPWLLLAGGDQAQNISRAEIIRPADFPFWLADFRMRYFTGQWALTLALFALGIAGWRAGRAHLQPTAMLLLLWFGVPLLLTLILNELAPTYQPRRVSQIVPAIVLLIALGLRALPRPAPLILLLVLTVYGTFSVDFTRYKQPWREFTQATAPLIAPESLLLLEMDGDEYAPRYHYGRDLAHSRDWLFADKNAHPDAVTLVGLQTWRDLQPQAYSAGLPALIDSVQGLWLFYWSSDRGALDWLATFGFQRTATIQAAFNPDVYLWRYDRLPADSVVTYDNGLTLRAARLYDQPFVELWWSTTQPLEVDYTISVTLHDMNGQIVAQHDAQAPMTTWQPQTPVYDPKPLATDDSLPAGVYTVDLVVYQFVNGDVQRLRTPSGDDVVRLGTINRQER